MKNDNYIRNFLINRRIENLYHFTNLRNLKSIIQHGLLPRSTLDMKNIIYEYNDKFRFDGKLNAICCSISFPNYKMFYKYRQQHPGDWIIIEISSEILYTKNCIYSKSNASNFSELEITTAAEHGLKELQQLFIDNEGKTRVKSGIPDHYPTDPQAEVLILDLIDLSYMKRIIFNDETLVKRYKGNTPTPVSLDRKFFKPRLDFRFWGKQNG